MTAYLKMSPGDMLQALGDDADKWADAFLEAYPDMPHDVMVGWFANAIENSGDTRRNYLVRDDQALMEHMDSLFRHRGLVKEFNLQHTEGSET